MARVQKKRAQSTPEFGPKNPEPRLFLGLGFLILGILLALAIGDYSPAQNKVFNSDILDHNLVGNFGVRIAYATLYIMGLAAYATPVLAFWVSYMFFRPYARKLGPRKLVPVIFVFLSLAVFGCMYQVEGLGLPNGKVSWNDVSDSMFPNGWGGWIGFWLYAKFLREFLGMVGSIVVFGVLAAFAFVFLLFDNLGRDIRILFKVKFTAWAEARAIKAAERAEQRARKQEEAAARKAAKDAAKTVQEAMPLPVAPGKQGIKLGRGSEQVQPLRPPSRRYLSRRRRPRSSACPRPRRQKPLPPRDPTCVSSPRKKSARPGSSSRKSGAISSFPPCACWPNPNGPAPRMTTPSTSKPLTCWSRPSRNSGSR